VKSTRAKAAHGKRSLVNLRLWEIPARCRNYRNYAGHAILLHGAQLRLGGEFRTLLRTGSSRSLLGQQAEPKHHRRNSLGSADADVKTATEAPDQRHRQTLILPPISAQASSARASADGCMLPTAQLDNQMGT
jgi:hypothetical protein